MPRATMLKCLLVASLVVAIAAASATAASSLPLAAPAYKDPSQPVNARVADLMARMTPQEMLTELYSVHNLVPSVYQDYKNTSFGDQKLTGFHQTTAADLVAARNKQQQYFVTNSRLHIPLGWHQETLNSAGPGGTLFPLPVNIGSTWNVSLAYALGAAIAAECRALGIDAAYSPEVNLYSDPRNGRLQEGFSEDPRLTAEMAVAQVLGEQGSASPSGRLGGGDDTTVGRGMSPVLGPSQYLAADKVAAVGKHYISYGAAGGGINSGPAHMSEYTLRDIYLAPWRSMVQRAGLRALMRSHEQWDHWPVHANAYLASIINDMGFNESWSISDCGDIVNIVNFQVAANTTVAAAMAVNASVDVENQCPPGSYVHLLDALDAGMLEWSTFNRSVARVLRHKFSAGLFDAPYTNTSLAASVLRSPENLALALDAARSSIVLLKNGNASSGGSSTTNSGSDGGAGAGSAAPLPLNPSKLGGKTIAVIGPNGGCGDDPNQPDPACDGSAAGGCQAQCSHIGKTFHPYGKVVHVSTLEEVIQAEAEALRAAAAARGEATAAAAAAAPTVKFARGADINTNVTTSPRIADAVALARTADVIVLVLGDSKQSAAENSNAASLGHDGGGGDRDSLDLPGSQQALLAAVSAARKSPSVPVVLVLVNGRQVTFDAFHDNALLDGVDALLVAWRGGEFGAQAIWDVITGRFNPVGRLSQSWPRNIGQLGGPSSPNLHTVVADWGDQQAQFQRSYFYSDASPLFAFGAGMGYTTFALSDASAAPTPAAAAAAAAGDLDSLLPRASDPAAGTGPVNPTVATVNVTAQNTGNVDGTVTVQVYAHDPSNVGAVRYYWRLVAWAQVQLAAGASRAVSIELSADALSFVAREPWSSDAHVAAPPTYSQRLFPGEYGLRVAQSANDAAAATATLAM